MVCKTREVGRMTEDIQSRILLTITGIVSAPHGQDRTGLIEILSEKSLMEQVEKMSTSQLITEQHGDPRVSPIFSRSVSESEVSQNPTCCFTKNGVAMKMWRLPDIPTEEEWAV
ncbi:hypothetical protein pdam_00026003, partial [Pocillopora damicornis]